MSEITPRVVFLMGPTASGKTDLAIQLTQQLPFEIVSVDSALVYRGMDIGTSKPNRQLIESIPHHLIDICDPSEAYSASQFSADALSLIQSIIHRQKIPLLVGGTMLYFRALQYGLSDLPSAAPELRQRIDEQAQQLGWQAMHQRLRNIDPDAAERIHPNDPQRIQRALEVYELTGQAMTDYWKKQKREKFPFDLFKIALYPEDRQFLYKTINQRFEMMLEEGLINEVKGFYERGDLNLNMPSMRAVGYRQVWQYFEQELNFQAMKSKAMTATRQLAKRQLTRLRAEQDVTWFSMQDKKLLDQVLKSLEKIPI